VPVDDFLARGDATKFAARAAPHARAAPVKHCDARKGR
jgi:hypothetical protein